MRAHKILILVVFMLVAALTVRLAQAEPATLKQIIVPYSLDSGALRNGTAAERAVFDEVIDGGNVPWVRLVFDTVSLAPGSRIELKSLADDAVQTLDADTLSQWQNTSAYFNGPLVRVRVISAAGSASDRVSIKSLAVGEWSTDDAADRSQCGPTDDRVPSNRPERGRLLSIGCTASIITEESCFLTAGHCLSSGSLASVVQFNVPPSLPSGTLQHPGPEDQYSLTSNREFTSGGVGNDWGLFKVFPNTETGLMPFDAQGDLLTLAGAAPAVGTTLEVVGYGVDDGSANQTQQVHAGPVVSNTGTTLAYVLDTEGGNSGSAVTRQDNEEVVAVHTHGGCTVSGTGSNKGTTITHPNLQSALSSYCGTGSPGVGCADIARFVATCNDTGSIRALALLNDASHAGESISIAIDGNPQSVTIGGRFGFLSQPAGSGPHFVTVAQPAGCGLVRLVSCP